MSAWLLVWYALGVQRLLLCEPRLQICVTHIWGPRGNRLAAETEQPALLSSCWCTFVFLIVLTSWLLSLLTPHFGNSCSLTNWPCCFTLILQSSWWHRITAVLTIQCSCFMDCSRWKARSRMSLWPLSTASMAVSTYLARRILTQIEETGSVSVSEDTLWSHDPFLVQLPIQQLGWYLCIHCVLILLIISIYTLKCHCSKWLRHALGRYSYKGR